MELVLFILVFLVFFGRAAFPKPFGPAGLVVLGGSDLGISPFLFLPRSLRRQWGLGEGPCPHQSVARASFLALAGSGSWWL